MRRTFLFLALVLASLASADDAYWSTVGTAGALGHSKDIRMESEIVRIRLLNHSMFVTATFNFKNYDRAQTVTMAFPDAIEDNNDRDRQSKFAIKWFHSAVDGKFVRTRRKVLDVPGGAGTYSAVWLKKVRFGKHGRRQVVCNYESSYGEGEGITTAYYVLRSGATWRGTIGDAKIYVDWSGFKEVGPPTIRLAPNALYTFSSLHKMGFPSDKDDDDSSEGHEPATKMHGRAWSMFELRNFEPTEDLSMVWSSSFSNFRVNGHSPKGVFLDDGGDATVKGPGRDPLIELGSIVRLFGTDAEIKDADDTVLDEMPTNFGVRNRSIEFPDRKHIRIDGKLKRLPRRLEPGESPKYPPGQWVHVRDLVKAIGGTYRYNSGAQRADIHIRW